MNYSIVATTFNDSGEILRFLDNIVQQKMLPKEIVIADGGSTDDTVQIMKAYQTQIPIVVISGQRLNIAEGYNKAIQSSRYEYVGIAGIGNYYETNYFECLSQEIEKENADMAFGLLCGCSFNEFQKLYSISFLGGERGKSSDTPTNHGCLVRKKIFSKVGFFIEDFIYAGEDEEFYNYAIKCNCKCIFTDKTKVYWDTPHNFKQLIKQIDNYMIGSMQINSIFHIVNKIKVSLLTTFSLAVCLIRIEYIVLFLILYISFIIKYKNINAGTIKMVYHVTNTYFFLKDIKYLQQKYKVGR